MNVTVKFGGFKTADNVHQSYELPHDILVRSVNADITDGGKLRRRKGSTLALSIAGAHSLWSGDGINSYFVQNNQLLKFNANATTTLMGAFAADVNHASYVLTPGGETYITCKTARGVIRNGVFTQWGLEVPVTPPTLIAGAGTLDPGTYYAAVTYLRADGRESGASKLAPITLTVAGGIAITAMPNPSDTTITKKRVYLTHTNGDIPYMAYEGLATDQFAAIGTLPTGARLRTAYLSPPPFGTDLAYYKGRVFIVDAVDPTVVWYTDSYDYDHVDTRSNYYKFGAPVGNIIAVTDGLYVCADQTYFITDAGHTEHVSAAVTSVGSIPGSAQQLPNSNDVIWMTDRGPTIGREAGAIELMAENHVSASSMTNSASMVREQDGLRQFLVVGNNTNSSSLRANSYAQAEIVRQAAGG